MTGAYIRVKRKDKWLTIEVEYLTDNERNEILGDRMPDELLRWLNAVCNALAGITESEE